MDKKMNFVMNFNNVLLMTLIGVVSYFGVKGVDLIEEFIKNTTANTYAIDINEFRTKQNFQRFDLRLISVEDDVDSLETDVKKLLQ